MQKHDPAAYALSDPRMVYLTALERRILTLRRANILLAGAALLLLAVLLAALFF